MSTNAAPERHRHEHDPWWGDSTRPATAREPAPSRRSRARRARTGIGWSILRVLAAPLRMLAARAARSPFVRRLVVRLAVLLVVVTFLACSVGVILINNVVIGRTAELGELDDRRRELRRDNALLGAEAARLSAPPLVVRRAERDLGMVRTGQLPQFVYLDPGSRRLTPLQRRRVAAREARLRARSQAAGGATSQGSPGAGG